MTVVGRYCCKSILKVRARNIDSSFHANAQDRFKSARVPPGEEAWLIGEHRMSGEKKYYLANLPAKTDLGTLAATIKARWICEQAHQQLKEELGLDHFEGRSWQGLHRHALMTMIAYAFLQHRRLATARAGKKNQRATAPADSASRAPRHPRTHRPTTAAAMPALPKMDLQRQNETQAAIARTLNVSPTIVSRLGARSPFEHAAAGP
jgi:SRSO17 transposase